MPAGFPGLKVPFFDHVVRKTWEFHPANRPTFSKVEQDIRKLLPKFKGVTVAIDFLFPPPAPAARAGLCACLQSGCPKAEGDRRRKACARARCVLGCMQWVAIRTARTYTGGYT